MTRLLLAVAVAIAAGSKRFQLGLHIWQLAETCLLYGTFAVMTLLGKVRNIKVVRRRAGQGDV